jgi:PAS domain S-box-containing protein
MDPIEPGRHEAPDADAARSRDLLRLLVQSVAEYAIYMLGPDGTVASWNCGAARMTGYAPDEVIGGHYAMFFPADERAERPERELREAERAGTFESEGWRRRKDGSRFWARSTLTALRREDGTLCGFGRVTRDLTEARGAAEVRRHLALAREAVRMRDDFLSIASHEFRTPLTVLKMELQLHGRSLRPGEAVTAAQVARVERLERHLDRLEALVGGLLRAGGMARGTLRLAPTSLDLVELVREVVDRCRSAGRRGEADLALEADAPVHGTWDRDRVAEALSAIVANAVKYGGAAPVVVRVRAEELFATVEIEDGGQGIRPEDHARIFERFERAAPIAHFGGFGVGLWVARQIAAAHGGDIEIRSEPGKGARFALRLPRAAAPAVASRPAARP